MMLPFFKSIRAFKDIGINDNDLSKILMQLQVKTFKTNQVIFNYGEEGDFFYIIISGLIDLYLPNPAFKKMAQEI
jgi:CRP-like cAMP-binding protein